MPRSLYRATATSRRSQARGRGLHRQWRIGDQREMKLPTGVKVDSSGNVYIADQTCATVRKITASTGDIAIIAGNGTNGYSGDG